MKTKKILALALAAVLLVAVSVAGTAAYLLDTTEAVVNTFNPTDIEVELTEEGSEFYDPSGEWQQSFDIIPGVNLDKEPLVSASASDPVAYYVFVKMNIANWSSYLSYELNLTQENNWEVLYNNNNTEIVFYRAMNAGTELENYPILKSYADGKEIQVSTGLTRQIMETMNPAPSMSFAAFAIQQEAFQGPADAWTTGLGKTIPTT